MSLPFFYVSIWFGSFSEKTWFTDEPESIHQRNIQIKTMNTHTANQVHQYKSTSNLIPPIREVEDECWTPDPCWHWLPRRNPGHTHWCWHGNASFSLGTPGESIGDLISLLRETNDTTQPIFSVTCTVVNDKLLNIPVFTIVGKIYSI